MPTGKRITCCRGDGIAVGQYTRVPDPWPIGAGRHFQHTIDQSVATPAHQKISAEVLADTPIDQRHDDDRRVQFTQPGHL